MNQTTFYAQFTPDQLRAGYARNAKSLAQMRDKALKTGRNVNGFTADYLRDKTAEYEALSHASDEDIRAHVSRPIPPYKDRQALRNATLSIGRE